MLAFIRNKQLLKSNCVYQFPGNLYPDSLNFHISKGIISGKRNNDIWMIKADIIVKGKKINTEGKFYPYERCSTFKYP